MDKLNTTVENAEPTICIPISHYERMMGEHERTVRFLVSALISLALLFVVYMFMSEIFVDNTKTHIEVTATQTSDGSNSVLIEK